MITTNCYQQNGILDVTLDRSTTSLELIKFLNIIEENNSYSRFLSILIKAPEGFEKIQFADLTSISSAINQVVKKYDKINIAFTVSNIREENLLFHLSSLTSEFNYQIETFNCVKDAIRWLRRSQLKVSSEFNHKKAG